MHGQASPHEIQRSWPLLRRSWPLLRRSWSCCGSCFFVAAESNFTVQLVHVPRQHSVPADALSSDIITKFFALATLGHALEAQIELLVSRPHASSTAAAYQVGIRHYLSFCHRLQVQPVPSGTQRPLQPTYGQ